MPPAPKIDNVIRTLRCISHNEYSDQIYIAIPFAGGKLQVHVSGLNMLMRPIDFQVYFWCRLLHPKQAFCLFIRPIHGGNRIVFPISGAQYTIEFPRRTSRDQNEQPPTMATLQDECRHEMLGLLLITCRSSYNDAVRATPPSRSMLIS